MEQRKYGLVISAEVERDLSCFGSDQRGLHRHLSPKATGIGDIYGAPLVGWVVRRIKQTIEEAASKTEEEKIVPFNTRRRFDECVAPLALKGNIHLYPTK